MSRAERFLALSGGVGGAKLSAGLAALLGDRLDVVVNTGDDFTHLGLTICPDLDSVAYALAGMNDTGRGWGVAQESWSFMDQVKRLGGEDWFLLGDRDLAMHVLRSQMLAGGMALDAVTAVITTRMGIAARLLPATNAPLRSMILTAEGPLPFQDWFVRLRCAPEVTGLRFEGADRAPLLPAAGAALASADLAGIILCPSNPYVSIDPILAVGDMRQRLRNAQAPRIAVSPFIEGRAIKGPAAEMARNLGGEASALGIARHYAGLIDAVVLDYRDAALVPAIEALGLRTRLAQTLMQTDEEKRALAAVCLDLCRDLGTGGHRG